ncbi:I78 family peptidase inhibitor [Streptomyces sp. RB6PN25]|uniref:I78 family peptidase inhibitor n=1 Tax=Streptomyces humicola TaxID=2953240 RepID=A0ABT1Q3D1_9ACTN|nr:I78 family peptidase inhibitor [Streptomyces humicola]MCQ4083255.1 I78 family peptidase inhibitor [Streptomyces humicola]
MTPVTNPRPEGNNARDDPDSYVGLPVEEARQRAAERGWSPVRTLPPDAVVTLEYVAGRLNLSVDNGRVVRCWRG